MQFYQVFHQRGYILGQEAHYFHPSRLLEHIPQTEWRINNRKLFLTVLEAVYLHFKVPAWPHSPEGHLVIASTFLLCSHMIGGAKDLSAAFFCAKINPSMHLPKAHYHYLWGVGISTYEFLGGQTFMQTSLVIKETKIKITRHDLCTYLNF